MKDLAELEAEKAAKLAEVAAIDAQIAAAKEPDWEAFKHYLDAAKGRWGPDMVRLADFVIRHSDAFAAAPLMPTAAMTEAEIEELARVVAGDWGSSGTPHDVALAAIRATLAHLGMGGNHG